MSRIGKKPVNIPDKVKVAASGGKVEISGPKGTLTLAVRPEIDVKVEDGKVHVSVKPGNEESRQARASWGTTRALIGNMIAGVTGGFEKKLEVVGVGWGATLTGKKLNLKVGLANTLVVPVPEGLTVGVDKAIVTINGADKQQVGQFASAVRALRKPEPYNGKGIKYVDEVIKRKAGKAFGK